MVALTVYEEKHCSIPFTRLDAESCAAVLQPFLFLCRKVKVKWSNYCFVEMKVVHCATISFFFSFSRQTNFFFFSLQLSTILAVHCATISFLFSLSLFTQSNGFFPALSLSPQTIISSFNSTFQDNNKRTNNSVLPYTMYFSKKRKYLHGWEIHFSILWQFEAQRIRSQKIHKGERNQLFCLILSVSPKTFCSCFFLYNKGSLQIGFLEKIGILGLLSIKKIN